MTMQLSLLLRADSKAAVAAVRSLKQEADRLGAELVQVGTKGRSANDALAKGAKAAKAPVDALTTSLQKQINALTGVDAARKSAQNSADAIRAAQQNSAAFQSLRLSLDDVFWASQQYEAALQTTNAAVRSGAITQSEANRVMALAEQQYLATGRSAQVMGAQSNAAAGQIGNITAQFNDIWVMLAAGQNPFQLAIQQGTQLNQVFNQMGSGRQIVRSLGAAVMSMVNPVSLLTIGLIAGGAALAQWVFSGEDAEETASDLEAAIASLREEAKGANGELLAFRTGAANAAQALVEEEIRRLEQQISAMQRRESALGPRARATGIDKEIAALERQLEILREQNAERDRAVGDNDLIQQAQRALEVADQQALREREIAAEAAARGERMLASLRDQAAIQQAITQYGEDSVQVAELRVGAERRAYTELVASMEISDQLKLELLGAWEAANGLAATSMSGPIAAAANEAARLAGELGISLSLAQSLAQARRVENRTNGVNNNGLDAEDPRNPNNTRGEVWDQGYNTVSPFAPSRLRAASRSRSGQGGGGGGGATAAETREIDALTERLRDQLAILRETDPVQKEMLRNREALADATDQERETISQLIEQRIAETVAIKAQEDQWRLTSSIATSALDALIVQGESLDDVLKRVIVSLADAAIEAATLGSGPLASLFGGSGAGKGGWLGSLVGAFTGQKLAAGGMVYGRGGGRADQVPILASSGEFMVNAAATARYRPMLEAINAGAPIRALAAGGPVSSGAAVAGVGGNTTLNINVNLSGARGNAEITAAAREGIEAALDQYDREVLPTRVAQIRNNPREIG